MLATHGYVNPTLIDGLTKPHNPGLEYDLFVYWNQRRLDANQAALARVGQGITRPVNGPLPNPVDATLSRGFCANGGSPASNLCATYAVAAAGVPGASQSGSTVTITTTAANVIKVADTVVISGVAETGYNGTFRVDSVPSATQFTYTNPTAGLPNSGGGAVGLQTSPNQAEGWDDLGPFYTQTYGAFFGVDGSTLEMCSSGPGCNGRLGSKIAQYVGFYSSADFWVENREAILADQVEMFVRGVNDADRPNCCDDPLVASRGFTEAEHNWMIPYPTAYIIPLHGGGQRSDAEANRMARWLLDNGITLERMTADFTWGSTTYPAGSYVVPLDQPMRGLALTALSAGQDFSVRINQLYAPPGAWSHGLMWGADTVEVPRGDASFTPATEVVTDVNALVGGVADGPADWYSVTPKGVRELQVIYDLLRDGIYGEIAEAPFVSTSGGPTPAGSLIFANDPVIVAALDAAGAAAGVTFERNVAVPKPATTRLSEAPKVAILSNANATGVFANNDTRTALKVIFGDDADFVSLAGGPNSIQNAADDPLLGYDVIYNTGQAFPPASYPIVATIAYGATSTATTATITTAANHALAVGSTVTIAGVTHPGYNGDVTVASVPTATTFTYAIAGPLPPSYGGTVTRTSVPITATGATWNVGTGAATVTTAAAHGQAAGASVTISGVGVPGYNGTFTVLSTTNTTLTYTVAGPLANSGGGSVTFAVPPAPTPITFPAASSQGTTASITTTAAHSLTVGAPVTISGVAEAGYNGSFIVTAVPTTTRFSYTTAGSDLPVSSGGSVAVESRARLNAYFARGGGYIATNTAATLTFLTGAVPALVPGTFTSANAGAGGGTGIWSNVGGAASPLTGAFPATDFFFLPSNVTYFNAIPTDAVVDGRYLPDMVNSNPRGPSAGWVAGLWLNRTSAASVATNNAPVIVHGTTSASSRYTAIATNPFSRSDFERIWGWVVQSALWSNLTDEALLDQTIDADVITDKTFGDPDFPITATASSGLTVSLAASGDCTVSSPTSPATIHITGAGFCTITASQAGTANYNPAPDVVQTITIAKAPQTITFLQPASPATFGSSFTVAPTASSGLPVTLAATGGCTAAGFVVTMTSGTVDCTLTASQAGNDDYLPAFNEVRTVSPRRAVLLVTPNPAAPSRQYSDPNPAIAAVITGYVNGDDAGDLTTLPTCSTTATPSSAPGTYPITCSGGAAANYSFSYDTGVLTVTLEDAVATYTGDTIAYATNAGETRATIVLRTTIRDSSLISSFGDAAPGDIRTAKVSFMEGGTTLCGPLAVGLVGTPLTTGSASCSVSLRTGSHTIDIFVNGRYTGSTQGKVVVLKAPKHSDVEGDGQFKVSASAGKYKADAGSTAKFEFDGEMGRRDLRADLELTYKAGSKTYEIELTSVNVLGKIRQPGGTLCFKPPSATCAGLGYLRGVAKLLDVSGSKPKTIGTGFTVQLVMTDKGKGTSDSVGFTLWDGPLLLFSSEWNGASTVERPLTKGNLEAE